MARNFSYTPRTAVEIEKHATQTGGSYIGIFQDGLLPYKTNKGDNWVRILPPSWSNPEHWGLQVFVHMGVGPQNATVLCPMKMKNKPCPECDRYAQYDQEDREDAYDFAAKKRYVVWVKDLRADKDKEKPRIWSMPYTLDRDICAQCRDPFTGALFQIDNPDSGYDLYFQLTADFKYTGLQKSTRPSQVEDIFLDYITAHPLPDCLIWRDAAQIFELAGGTAPLKSVGNTTNAQAPPPPPSPSAQVNQTDASLPSSSVVVVTSQIASNQALCDRTVTYKNQKLGCSLTAGHPVEVECDFSRELGLVPVVQAPVSSVVAAPPAPPTVPVAQSAAPAATTTQDTQSRLRSRFAKR